MTDSQGIAEASKILSSLNPTTPVTEEDVKDTMSTHGTLYVQHLAAKQLSQRFGIISFSTEYTDPLMWALYTEDGSGFVIGYDAEQLKPLCEVLDTVIYELRPFLISVYQPLSHEDNIHTLLRLKGHQWTHENEWRMIVRLDKTHRPRKRRPTSPTDKRTSHPQRSSQNGLLHRAHPKGHSRARARALGSRRKPVLPQPSSCS